MPTIDGKDSVKQGQKVYYYSNSHKRHLVAYVERVNANGTVDLDVRKGAALNSISVSVPKGFSEVSKKEKGFELEGTLKEFGKDLVQMAKDDELEPLVGRADEIRSLMQILARKTKNNPMVVGESGVGKTKLVMGLAQRIADGKVPPSLKDKHLISIDVGTMVAGASYKGQLEERVKSIMDCCLKGKGEVILFLDDIHMALQAGKGDGSEGGLNIADLIKPAIEGGEMAVIGTTTFKDYKKTISKDTTFSRRFQQVPIEEPTIDETIAILQGIRGHFEEHHDVDISSEALESAAKLSSRYVTGRFLPDKAIDCLDEACAALRMDLDEKKKGVVDQCGEQNIAGVISNWTKIPLEKLTMAERDKLLNLETILGERVLGQDEAVRNVADAILRARASLNRPNGPLGSFLFVGSTGTGKTELAKTLAMQLFDDESHMVRLDMSEYMQPFSVTRMIGAPPGYAGYEEGGQLTEAVRKKPYSVVLFDEVEKAHVNVFNLLLQVLDDGRLTDGQGTVIDFTNTVIIMTSNLGAQAMIADVLAAEDFEEGCQNAKETCMEAAKNHFRPEFLNRLDAQVFFRPLTKELLRNIVQMQLEHLGKRMEDRGIELHMTDEAVDVVLENSYSPEYGARPVRRYLEKNVGTALSRVLIAEDIPECDIWLMPLEEDQDGISDDCPLMIEIREKEKKRTRGRDKKK